MLFYEPDFTVTLQFSVFSLACYNKTPLCNNFGYNVIFVSQMVHFPVVFQTWDTTCFCVFLGIVIRIILGKRRDITSLVIEMLLVLFIS